VQRSLDLFPLVEKKAEALGLPLIKLDTFRHRGAAARFGVTEVPALVRIEDGKKKEPVAIP